MILLGRIPREGETAEWNGLRFEVAAMDGRRVERVVVSKAKN